MRMKEIYESVEVDFTIDHAEKDIKVAEALKHMSKLLTY